MSIIGIAKEKVGAREKKTTPSSTYYKRVYLVESNNPKEDPYFVENAFGLPRLGFNYVSELISDMDVACNKVEAKQITHLMWEVVIEYEDIGKVGFQPGSGSSDPLNDEPVYRWGNTQVREVVTGQSVWKPEYENDTNISRLFSNEGILNSAYEPYVPPAEIDRLIPTLTFKRNEPVFNYKYMLWYVNSVNSVQWYGWPARTIKVLSITGDLKRRKVGNVYKKYWEVLYVLGFNKYTWDLFLLDQGSYYFEGGFASSGAIKKAFTVKGGAVTRIGLLTSDGDKSTTISRYNRYRVLEELPIQNLMIPMVI